ncbi:MAG: PIN domain-containing protein [Betaproteobacteria bacterium]|nr:PIN domain-containing protein [Betaproteobacteria bacterium]
MRVYIDANVLFSAAYAEPSRTRAIFELAAAGFCEVITSAYAPDEARRNLLRRYPERVAALDQLASRLGIVSEPNPEFKAWAAALGITEKDVPILAAAAQAGAEWLVSGDRGFASLYGKKPRGVDVMLPAEAIRKLLE